MNISEINKKYFEICNFVELNNLKSALDSVKELFKEKLLEKFKPQFEQLLTIYQYVIKYTIQGIHDPNREEVFTHFKVSLMELADKMKTELLFQTKKHVFSSVEQSDFYSPKYSDADLLPVLNELNSISNLQEGDKRSEYFRHFPENFTVKEIRESVFSSFFNYTWASQKLSSEKVDFLYNICKSDEVLWNEKCLIVSALTLSSLNFFDENKVELLIDFFDFSEENVWQRALVGIVFVLYVHNKRLSLYPKLIDKLTKIYHDEKLEKGIEHISIQLVKAKETEQITKTMHTEIIPHMAKISNIVKEKLDLEHILGDDLSDDKNPDWEDMFQDSPELLDKMGKLSMMQLEGSDVFMTTFAMLKHFPFFKTASNWFVPFHVDNALLEKFEDNSNIILNPHKFFDGIEKVPFICNSDKYSFCLNVLELPDSQKSMLVKLFSGEMEGMMDVAADEKLLHKDKASRYEFTQYIQDIYRFYKLSPYRELFLDLFEKENDLHEAYFYPKLVGNDNTTRLVAEMYFDKGFFEKALKIYKTLEDNEVVSYEVFQKIAYSYQKRNDYVNALNYYLKAELYDQNKIWNLKKIAYCYQTLQNHEKALEYYNLVQELEPEDLQIQVHIGNCYLNAERYEEALKYFYKVEYFSPSNVKAIRPIAWCSFLLGKFDASEKYYTKLLEIEGNKYDFMNIGHVELCRGEMEKAANYYLNSMKLYGKKQQSFFEDFNLDLPNLKKLNVNMIDIPILLDYLRFKINNEFDV